MDHRGLLLVSQKATQAACMCMNDIIKYTVSIYVSLKTNNGGGAKEGRSGDITP